MALEALPESGALWLENLVPKGTIASHSTQQRFFSATNLLLPQRCESWRTTALGQQHVVFDLGEAVIPRALALIDVNFAGGGKIRFRGSDDAAQTLNSLYYDLDLYPADPIQRVLRWYPGTTPTFGTMGAGRRFWGIRFRPNDLGPYDTVDEQGQPADYFEIGAVWIGSAYEPIAVAPHVDITPIDASDRQTSYGRSQWTDPFRPAHEVNFAVEHLDFDAFYALKSSIADKGAAEAILDLHANTTDPSVKASSAFYGYFAERPLRSALDSPSDNRVRVTFEEAAS